MTKAARNEFPLGASIRMLFSADDEGTIDEWFSGKICKCTNNKASKLPLGPILVGSGGLLLAGTGAALLGVGMGKTATAEKNCPTRQQCSDADAALGNDGRTFTTIGGVSLGIGLAAMAGGVTWFLLGRSADEQAPTSGWVLAPNVTTSPSGRPTLQGFSLAGHF